MQNDTQIRKQLRDVLELARERLYFERDRTGPGAKFRQELDRGQKERGIADPFAVHDHYVELVKELNSHGDFFWLSLIGQLADVEYLAVREMTHWMNGINDLWESGYFDWQSGLARQALDEGKHAKVFCDVLIEKGLLRIDKDLYANEIVDWTQRTPMLWAINGKLLKLRHVHPAGRAANQYFGERSFLGPLLVMGCVKDPVIAESFISQLDEECFHVNLGSFALDQCATNEEAQAAVTWEMRNTENYGDDLFAPMLKTAVECEQHFRALEKAGNLPAIFN